MNRRSFVRRSIAVRWRSAAMYLSARSDHAQAHPTLHPRIRLDDFDHRRWQAACLPASSAPSRRASSDRIDASIRRTAVKAVTNESDAQAILPRGSASEKLVAYVAPHNSGVIKDNIDTPIA